MVFKNLRNIKEENQSMLTTLLPCKLGDHVIIKGDILDHIGDFSDGQFKLIITSPPYNIGKQYEKSVNLDDYLNWQQQIISKLINKLSNDGSIVWQTGNYVENGEITPLDICFYPIFKKLGLKLRNRIIWHFEHGLHCTKRFSGRYETALWFTKSDKYTFNLDNVRVPSKYPGKLYYTGPKKGQPSGNPLGKNPSDFWKLEYIEEEFQNGIIDIPNVKNNHPEKTAHPCQFPIELIERFILACTNEHDYILDPFGGVGTSLIASIKNNRHGIMCEVNDEYIKIAEERIHKLSTGELKMRPIGKQIYKPSGNEKVSKIPLQWLQKDLK